MNSRPWLILSAVASLVFLLARPYSTADWLVVLKVLSTALLAAMGIRVSRLLGAALSLGAIGDFLLEFRSLGPLDAEKLFLFGLVAFLLGHLVYIVLFIRFLPRNWARHSVPRELAVTAILLTLGFVLMNLQQFLGPLLVPVIVYALALAAMAIAAQLGDFGNPLVALGALSFVASDAMLATAKFRGPFAASHALIWITYYLAQLLIFLGISRALRRTS